MDCLVDAGRRELGTARPAAGEVRRRTRPSAGRLASRLVTGIRLRNFLTFVNSYYDDMAWLALATLRLEQLAEESRTARPAAPRPHPQEPDAAVRFSLHGRPRRRHVLEHEAGLQEHPRHGTRWRCTTPARATRRGHRRCWTGWTPSSSTPAAGLYLDGLRINAAGEAVLEDAVYTYNQGPVLGALLELGGTANLARAAEVVDAVARHLTIPGGGTTAAGAPDAGARARAHRTPAAPVPPSSAATEQATAGCSPGFWRGTWRSPPATDACPEPTRATAARTGHGHRRGILGRPAEASPRRSAGEARPAGRPDLLVRAGSCRRAATYPPGAAVELSTQLQAWMALEAAASMSAGAR